MTVFQASNGIYVVSTSTGIQVGDRQMLWEDHLLALEEYLASQEDEASPHGLRAQLRAANLRLRILERKLAAAQASVELARGSAADEALLAQYAEGEASCP